VGIGNKEVTIAGVGVNDGDGGNDYNLTLAPNLTSTINKANLTLSGTQVYNGTTIFAGDNLTATGVNGESFTMGGAGASGNLSVKDVQTNQLLNSVAGLTVGSGNSGAALAGNYNLTVVGSSVSVTPAILTLSGTQVYDGLTAFSATNLTLAGVNTESFALTGSGVLSTKNVQTNQALASVAGLTVGAGNTGAAVLSNYTTLTAADSSVSVTKASLTVSTSNVVKTYDGGTTALGTPIITVGQLFGADALASGPSGPVFAFIGKDVGIGNKTVTVAGVTVNDGDGGNDYNLTLASNTTSTINKANLTLGGTRVYDGTTIFAGSNLTATGVDGETFTVTGAGAAGDLGTKNVQTNQALASVAGLALGSGNTGAAVSTNYNVLTASGSLVSVTKAKLTLSGARVYDSTTIFAGSILTATGVDGETFAVTGAGGTGDLSTKDVQTNQALASVAGLALGSGSTGAAVSTNYTALATTGSSVSVTPANLTLSGTRVYDGTTIFAGSNLTATGVDGEIFSVAGAGASGNLSVKDVQTNQALASVAGLALGSGNSSAAVSGNYNALTATNSSVSVTAAPLTIAADDKSRGVNLANPALTATYTGLVGGDTSAAVTGLILSTTAVTSSPVGSYPISASGASALDYAITFVPGTLNVGQVPLSIEADDKSQVYGAALPTFTASYDGFVNGDTASVVTGLQFSTTATIGSNVGTYSITPFGATAPNYYVVGYVPGTLTINPASLTITANDASRLYGGNNPEFGASYTGFVNGDTPAAVSGLTLTTTAETSSPVGSYPITASAGTAANYVITYLPGTLSVGQAPLSITADNQSKVYGADLPTFTATYTGLLNGDTASVVSGLQFSTTATIGSNVGTYSITPFGGTSANYLLSYASGTLTIDPAALTITADDASRPFGAANPVFTASYDGFVNGDTSAVVSGLTIASDATPASGVGPYAITPSGAVAPNYTIAFVAGTLEVADSTVTVGVTPEPVVTVGQVPVVTSNFAVVDLDNRLVLVPVNSQGGIVQNANNTPASVDGNLTLSLDDVAGRTSPAAKTVVAGGTSPAGFSLAGGSNLGSYELVGSLSGDTVLGGSGGRLSAQDQNDPGLYRESKVSMGGFNVIYHEELGEARRQNRSNTALGSSYREFSDSDNPQVIVVRAKADRKPSNRVPGPNS